MAGYIARAVSTVTRIPPLTVGNIALALLGLPLFIILLGVTNTDVQPIITVGVYWALAFIVIGIAMRGEGLSLTDLGFRRPDLIDFGYILVTSIAIFLIYVGTGPLIEYFGFPVQEGVARWVLVPGSAWRSLGL